MHAGTRYRQEDAYLPQKNVEKRLLTLLNGPPLMASHFLAPSQ